MKKVISLITVFLALIVAACAVYLAGCSPESESNLDSYAHLIDLSKYEIGDEIPSYPDCEFDYRVNDDCIIHIDNITATLSKKNFITDKNIIEGRYCPYEITVGINGSTDISLAGIKFYIAIKVSPTSTVYEADITIEEDGKFSCDIIVSVFDTAGIYFYYITKD